MDVWQVPVTDRVELLRNRSKSVKIHLRANYLSQGCANSNFGSFFPKRGGYALTIVNPTPFIIYMGTESE